MRREDREIPPPGPEGKTGPGAILFGTKVAATPLSLWERVGVRVQGICATSSAPSPGLRPASPRGRGKIKKALS
jgi:hypothetical protein